MTFHKYKDGSLEYRAMAPTRMNAIRIDFGMDRVAFGELIGYTGEPKNIEKTIQRMEMEVREIPPMVERLLMLLVWFKSDYGYLPDLDNGQREPMATPEVFDA